MRWDTRRVPLYNADQGTPRGPNKRWHDVVAGHPLRSLRTYARWFRKRPLVRPWALSAPIFVLLICLPLMRPLRHPVADTISDDEQGRLATIQAIVEHHTLQIQQSSFATRDTIMVKGRDGQPHWYSDQAPVMAALLSGPYWVMHHAGLSFEREPVITEYLLTLFGVTLPIAFAAGLLYRMARIFELPRPARAGLALAVVVGSGWISYGTVLSSGAAAAALVVMGAAALVQSSFSKKRWAAIAWVATGGFCTALAATYDLTALAFLVFLLLVICGFRWPWTVRIGAIVAYSAAAIAPLLLYATLMRSITGDLRPGFLHTEAAFHGDVVEAAPRLSPALSRWTDEEDEPPTFWHSTWRDSISFLQAFIGGHGLLTHFPVLILGMLGVGTVLRRHWPTSTKAMVCATILASLAIVIGYTLQHADWNDAMFANRWFLVILPLTLFWAGAWLRHKHHPSTWVAAALLWGFSALIALVGATDPQPRNGYDQYKYTAAGAFMNLVRPPQISPHRDLVASN